MMIAGWKTKLIMFTAVFSEFELHNNELLKMTIMLRNQKRGRKRTQEKFKVFLGIIYLRDS